jgi:hypothetical protein
MDVSAPIVEAPIVEAPIVEAPKKPIVRKTIPKKYLDYLKFAFVAMNNAGAFAEIVKLKEPVDTIINNVKAIVDNEELGERINEIRKELLKKPREKKALGAPKASSKKRKADSEAPISEAPISESTDTTLVNTLVDGLTNAEPKTPRKKAKPTPGAFTTPPSTSSTKDEPKTPRKKAKPVSDQNDLTPVVNALSSDFAKAE